MESLYSKWLLISDIDGTLNDKSMKLPKNNKDAIESYVNNGGIFTLCSGRNLQSLAIHYNKLGIKTPAIFLNGAGIYDCLETACAVGSRNLTALDALSGIKTMEETHELMKTLSKNVYTYDESYWTRDEATGLIFGKCDKTQK